MKKEDFSGRLIFSLENFEGPLDLLSHLIQKEEINVLEVELKKITSQFISEKHENLDIDVGSEFLFDAASLLALKARKMLPLQIAEVEDEVDPPSIWLESLIEYSRFKEIASKLLKREEGQKGLLPRGLEPLSLPRPLGLQEISLETLSQKFQELLKKIPENKAPPQEKWSVEDKIYALLALISDQQEVSFTKLSQKVSCKEELIVMFLAILEMMKTQQVMAFKQGEELILKPT